eukprot:CAMPEP_0180253456 /NCGR_PEP_ID=MMETSP0987-20121128/39620_1 /TAXON_ID=697907 /ORGANISM="non described non described, Strain CCMP2293" /LENGTH=95 /DNA_ID=CAMNT_0022222345 /DNA_START=122 /DNA_END=407 /DNA_ORIENTATION=-
MAGSKDRRRFCVFLLFAFLALLAAPIGGENGPFSEEESHEGEAFLVAPATAPLGRLEEAFAAQGGGARVAVVDEGEEGYSLGAGDEEEKCLGRAE